MECLTCRNGSMFTWCNNQTDDPLSVKLDRAMGNTKWREAYPNAFAEFAPPGHSDHTPCLIRFPDTPRQLCSSLKQLKRPLRALNSKRFSQLSQRVQEAQICLSRTQDRVLNTPTPELIAEEKSQRQNYMILAAAEERFYRQRSRIQWLRMGDKNTAYFHRCTSSRIARNHIHYLEDENGNRLTTLTQIKAHVVSFYTGLLGVRDTSVRVPSIAWLQELIPYRWSGSLDLDAIPTDEDIKNTFFSLPDNKAPGPDGYPKEFYTES
ncbi:PREDICTED: uncharacterized protein LOC104824202 [Tarenaya hassleriana]|uniref:uncharacterized protein LOC104824202 n=1 Tax=Tarenaya hassleriana TaxID=28532 RepID=UPI00053C53EE|nr:PREDICTED: uncharacterized protein LOC104824202 [Tarenaya hassleriana]